MRKNRVPMQPFVLLNKNKKETFKDYATTKEILRRYQTLKEFPIRDLKKQAERACKKSLIKELTKNSKEVAKGIFDSLVFYRNFNLIVEYKSLKKIKGKFLIDNGTKFLIKLLEIDSNVFTDCLDDRYKQFYDIKKVQRVIIEKKLNKKTFTEIAEIYEKFVNEKIKKKIIKKILRILLLSLQKKSLIIFSESERKFLRIVNYTFKDPNNFLKPIYKESISNKKSTDFLFKEKLYNKQEIVKFLIKNFNLFLKEFKSKFLFEIARPKNVSKLYFLLQEFDKKKAEVLENYIHMYLCNYILKYQTINYEKCLYFENIFKNLKTNSNFKRIWLIYKLYLFDHVFKVDKQYIHKIQKSVIKYFPPYFEIKLDFPLETKKMGKTIEADLKTKDNQERLDLFSTIKIKIETETLIITFIQFLLINSFSNEEKAKEEINDNTLTSSNIKYLYFQYIDNNKESNELLRHLEPHFELIKPVVDKYFSHYVHNSKLKKVNSCNKKLNSYIPDFYTDININNEILETNLPANVNANIIKICKKEKTIKKLILFKQLTRFKLNYSSFLKALKELEEKGYLKSSKELVNYLP